MPTTARKMLHERSTEDIITIVREDFDASEYDRQIKNQQNFQHYRAFHCRDILSIRDVAPQIEDGERIINGRLPAFDLGAIEINKTYLPWLRGIALTSVARLAHGLWPDFNDFWRLDPDHPNDEKAVQAGFGLANYFIRASRYKQEALLALLQCHLFDFGILYTGWRTDFGVVPVEVPSVVQVQDPESGEYLDTGQEAEGEREVQWQETIKVGWDCSNISTLNFRYDPEASHEGFGEFCGVTTLMPKSRGWELVEAGEWDEAAMAEIDDDETPNKDGHDDNSEDLNKKLREDEKLQGSGGFDMAAYINKRYMRAEFYWDKKSRVVVLNRKAVPLKDRAWRIPFFKQVFMQNFGQFGGTSLVEPLIPAQHDINQCLRLLRTQQDRAVNPDSVTDTSFFNSPLEADMQPWGTGVNIMLTANMAGKDPRLARTFIEHPGTRLAQDLWGSITLQTQFGERASGVSSQDQGIAQGGASATEIARAAMGVDIRGAFIEVYIEDSIVVKPFDDLLRLINLNVREPMRIKLRGEEGMDWQTIMPDDLKYEKSPTVVALGMSSMSSRAVGAQAVRDVTLAFLQNPMTAQWMKVVSSMQDVYRQYDIDPDKYVNDQDMIERQSIPPKYVPVLLASGIPVPVNAWDDHEEVIQAIVAFRQSPKFDQVPEENKRLMLKHIELRVMALKQPQGGVGMPSPASPFGGGGGAGVPGGAPQGAPGGPQPMPVQSPSGGAPIQRRAVSPQMAGAGG